MRAWPIPEEEERMSNTVLCFIDTLDFRCGRIISFVIFHASDALLALAIRGVKTPPLLSREWDVMEENVTS